MPYRIEDLPDYGAHDLDKSKGDIYEVSKNSGTSGAPVYAAGDSKKVRLDELAEHVAQVLPYIVLTSPDGHRWKFTVDDTGMLSMPAEDLGI